MQQIWQTSLPIGTYECNNQRVRTFFFTCFREIYRAAAFLNGSQYLHPLLKSTARRSRSLLKLTTPSTFGALVFRNGILLVHNSFFTKILN